MPHPHPTDTLSFDHFKPYLLKVLANPSPLRLIKSGKHDGVFASRSAQNAKLIHALTGAAPRLLETVEPSGKVDKKAVFVRLSDAGLNVLATELPAADLEAALASADGSYRERFKASCLKASETRLRGLAAKQRRLADEGRRLIESAQKMINAERAALDAEYKWLSNQVFSQDSSSQRVRLEPCHDRDYEFIQRVADLLVLAWHDTSDSNSKAILEDLLRGIGAAAVAPLGSTAKFDGRYHDTLDDVDVDEDVSVVQSGWQLKTHRGPLLLAKAQVQRLNHSAQRP